MQEWLEPFGGAEQVVERLCGIFPDATIATLWNDAPGRFASGRVSETWLARTPLRRHKALALPVLPSVWRHMGRSDAEWIICCSHLFAHHARFSGPARDARKLVYVYTPARYIWTPELDDRGRGIAQRLATPGLRALDRHRAQEADAVAAVSRSVAQRIERTWEREATVIHPPVDVDFFIDGDFVLTDAEHRLLDSLPETFLLGASRFVPYKRLDLAIAAGVAADVPVVLAGDGPERPALEELAAQHPGLVTFVGRPSRDLLGALYRKALAFVFLPVEDFGIMPVEAMGAGTPVIGRSIGGTSETVLHGETGFLIDEVDERTLRTAVEAVAAIDRGAGVTRARTFDGAHFDRRIEDWVLRDSIETVA